jgi:tetratricopeptide (TPR) repeat protein
MRRLLSPVLLSVALAATLAAQGDLMGRAYELERRGDYAAAATAYAEVLRTHPENLSALLGLERALTPLHRIAELAAPAEALLRRDSTSAAAYSIALRGWAAAGRPDSVAAVVRRWARVEPADETPYREWGEVLLSARDLGGAKRAYLTGRERMGDPSALAGELALLAAAENDWEGAAREWAVAIGRYPGYRLSARNALARAPDDARSAVLRALTRGSPAARRLAAELEAQWGDPAAGYALLSDNLPGSNEESVDALRQFLDASRAADGPAAARTRGQALEQIALRSTGAGASRTRLEAARAYADGGDAPAARRMLADLAADGSAPPEMASGATATLVTVLLKEGQVAEAERQLAAFRATLPEETANRLASQVAEGWVRQGNLDRAEAALANDSTVEAIALGGRILLYRGDLKGAATALREAGPFAGSREDATARTTLLALIQPIEADSLPALGAALLSLARGDSALAVRQLEQVADGLPPQAGGAELRLLAGQVEAGRGRAVEAERLLRAASDSTAPATAPAAELALAQLLLSAGRTQEATGQLEHLILAYPGSAVVPQARRLLDIARGAVPES